MKFSGHTYYSLLLILFLSISAYSEVFSWVDKDGKKHYGDKIPAEYAKQGETIKVEPTNTIQSVKVDKSAVSNTSNQNRFQNQTQEDPLSGLNACEREKALYQESEDCFLRCESDKEGRLVHNVARCNCVDRKKPNC